MDAFLTWCERHERTAFWATVAVFVVLRLLGAHSPLHQDEYKWPLITSPSYVSDVNIPHPPLSELIYRTGGHIVGYGMGFRYIPFFFGLLDLFLLYYYLRSRFNTKTAILGSAIFSLSYFSILASLMVDTDGAILPFFFLLCLIFYEKARRAFAEPAKLAGQGKRRAFAILGLAVCAALGFFVKVSFILPIAAIALDFLWEQRSLIDMKKAARYALYALGFFVGLGALLLVAHSIFPFFNLSASASYWIHFAHLHRNWFQTFIQVVKALFYASPFLVFAPAFLTREGVRKARPMLLYIAVGLIFYVALFDFSTGALDRYMQYIIVPLSVIAAIACMSVFAPDSSAPAKKAGQKAHSIPRRSYVVPLAFMALATLLILLSQFIPHYVPSLNPKSEWISRIASLRWDFVYPFSGGSGPIGFYVSFLFMALSWIVSACVTVFTVRKPSLRAFGLASLLIIGIAYNAIFTEEYLFGFINGSASRLIGPAVSFIESRPEIEHVIVYNDNGGYEVQQTGTYARRMYADPMFVDTYKKVFSSYSGHVLEVDVPRIDPNSIYRKYLDSCSVIYDETDRKMEAKIYSCQPMPSLMATSAPQAI